MASNGDNSVANDKVVSFTYVLESDEGQILETSEKDPMVYLHGYENIIMGLERQMLGHQAGDRFAAVVSPEEGYGQRLDVDPVAMARDAFPDDVEVGMVFEAEAEDGEDVAVWVLAIEEDLVLVDQNHPLAGQTLHFQIEMISIRDATPEEIEHGHPHEDGCA